jgi:hypothetical protein
VVNVNYESEYVLSEKQKAKARRREILALSAELKVEYEGLGLRVKKIDEELEGAAETQAARQKLAEVKKLLGL